MKLMSNYLSKAILALAVIGCSANVLAAKPNLVLQQPNVSLELANELIDATMAACHAEANLPLSQLLIVLVI
ncbi:hypothetical protein [Psychrobacter sp. JCM 18903]|uniref:hypothetical protein n=1 Tax=Psychrobacter sp. JCM 18903 TaxID=1298610 RepID=UPI001FB07AAB|nr:hypothetical protein [Psychrobacter sp. JCM 18903]